MRQTSRSRPDNDACDNGSALTSKHVSSTHEMTSSIAEPAISALASPSSIRASKFRVTLAISEAVVAAPIIELGSETTICTESEEDSGAQSAAAETAHHAMLHSSSCSPLAAAASRRWLPFPSAAEAISLSLVFRTFPEPPVGSESRTLSTAGTLYADKSLRACAMSS